MKRLFLVAALTLFAGFACADVTITNLAVAQRPGTKLVDITYDVSSTTTNAVTVSLTVSNGAVKVNATNLTGAVGAGVPTGTGKSMVWNMVPRWNGNVATLSFSVMASDASDGPSCVVAKTGQTTSYRTGDDGDLETGVAWPNPRFTDLSDGTVRDNLTGLEWVQDPHSLSGDPHSLSGNSSSTNWNAAVDFCNNLVYAGHYDWRLPSRKELMSLVDYEQRESALPAGHPSFGYVFNDFYWSGTSLAEGTAFAWCMFMADGWMGVFYKDNYFYVWPVRGGQQ